MESLRNVFVSASVVFLSISSAFAFEPVQGPDHNVGNSWTYKGRDGYGKDLPSFTVTCVAKSESGYTMERSVNGLAVERYDVSKHMGRVSSVQGNVGNGERFDFPLTKGKKWSYVSFWEGTNGFGKDDITYEVTGEADITTAAGTFKAIVIKGDTGRWSNLSSPYSGNFDVVEYYSPVANTVVRSERTNYFTGGGAAQKRIYILESYELK
jgi:hypothetical protein